MTTIGPWDPDAHHPGHGIFDPACLRAAEAQMRLVLLAAGAMTLDQVNNHTPGLTRAVVGAYLSELRFHTQTSGTEEP